METIVLDWSALSQVVQQGETGALEQALRSVGSKFVITDHGLCDILKKFRPDFEALKKRLNIQTITIEADFSRNTKENRRLGVVFDQYGKPRQKQLADAAIRWLESEKKLFSKGGYRLLSNDRGLIDDIEKLAPASTYQSDLDLLGRAVLRGDLSASRYSSFLRDFSLPDGSIRGISPQFTDHLTLSDELLVSIETAQSGGVQLPEHFKVVRLSEIARRFKKLLRGGSPVAVLGIAAVPVFSMVQARAAERNIPFDQAARELGIEFGEDEFRDLLAEVGADAAITAIPVAGWLKKAWDVLGNVDDIVAVTQLYGAAYPDNETIQQMAGIADAVEGTAIFETYVEGRDALTGAVGGAIDWVFGTSTDENEQARSLGDLRELVEIGGDAAGDAFKAGATQEQVADVLTSALQARAAALVTSGKPLAEEQAPLSAPVPMADQLSPETVLPGDGTVPASAVPTLPGAQPILPSSLELGLEPALEPGLDPASGQATTPAASGPIPDRAGVSGPDEDGDRFLRKTSYRTFRKIGRTPEEEQQGNDELWEEFEQGYLEMNGHEQAAELLTARRFSRRWALSDYAEDADGLMLKYPLERVYPNIEEICYSYVDEDVNAALSHQGIRAKKWYLTPNDKTGGDWEQGWMDEDGYGPRMTLAYDDEAGQRHRLSDSYQVNVRGAAIKLKQKQLKAERMKAGQTAPAAAAGPRVDIPKKAPVSLQTPTSVQAPVPTPKPDVRPLV